MMQKYVFFRISHPTKVEKIYKSKQKAMSERKLRFAIFGNVYQAKKSMSIQKVLSFLSERGARVSIDKEYHRFLVDDQHIDMPGCEVFEGDAFDADFVISMGGDGTFLKAAARVGSKSIPIVGVNMGRLGFLADISPAEIESSLRSIYKGDFQLEEHAVLCVDCPEAPIPGNPFALNDIAVLKRDNASMISIRTCVNGEYLATYQADGLVVSTPTGSTAYSLSNGGPIVAPQAGVICLTPVAPHSLNVRPLVLPDDSIVTVSVESRTHQFLVAIDGRSEKCSEGVTLTIRKAAYPVRIIKRHGQKYFSTLREKMQWGVDLRK